VCTKGKKIGNSEVTLLQKMGVKPFFYNMNVLKAYDNGAMLNEEICGLSPEDVIGKF